MSEELVTHLKRKAWKQLLLWLLPAMVGTFCFALDLGPSPHWVWDAGFLLLTFIPLCGAILVWIRLQADLAAGFETVPCKVLRVDEAFPGIPQVEVETRTGRLLLYDLRAERVVADYDAVHELTYARHLGWALALHEATPRFPARVN